MQALHRHRILLQNWRLEFVDDRGHLGMKGTSKQPQKETINALIEMGKIKLYYHSSHNRTMWEDVKISKKKYNNFRLCFACKKPAQVRHHIIWISNGGRNQKNNIIALCKSCHAKIHPWLIQ